MSTLSDYTDALTLLVPGSHPLEAEDLSDLQEKAVASAMAAHSRHKPRTVVEDVTADGGVDYALADLTDWLAAFSVIAKVEYPVDDDDGEAAELDTDEWEIYAKPAGDVLRLVGFTPTSGESIRVTYTARHTCTALACSVAAGDEEAVQALAASFFCKSLAAAYALDQDGTIDADSVQHSNRSSRFSTLAKDFRKEYEDHMGIRDGKPRPACAVQDQDVNYPGGMDRLTHPRRYR